MLRGVFLVGCVLLTYGLSHAAAQSPQSERHAEPSLQAQVNALVQQLHLRYADPTLVRAKRSQVESVLEAWNRVAHPSSRDREAIRRWLDTSLDVSMPGHSGRLPAAPRFAGTEPAEMTKELRSKPVTTSKDTTPVPKQRSKWSQHPAAAPVEWIDPFQDDDSEEKGVQENGGAGASLLKSDAQRWTSLRPTISNGLVVVNRKELAKRIREYNVALRAANLELLGLEANDTHSLGSLADELERLARDRRFVELYLASMAGADLVRMPTLIPAEVVNELARRKAASVLHELPRERSAEQRELERVADRLTRL